MRIRDIEKSYLPDAPAANVDPTAGKLALVYPFPTTDVVTLLKGIPVA